MKNWVTFFMLSICITISGQDYADATHELITDIIFQDTVIPEQRYWSIKEKVLDGQLTKEDSIKYIKAIKNRELLLFANQTNSTAYKLLSEDLKNNGTITAELSEDIVRKAMKHPLPDAPHDWKNFGNGIKLTKLIDKWLPYHEFSAPMKIGDNKFIIYHYRNASIYNGSLEFIVYNINSQAKYKIEKVIGLLYN